MIEHTRESVERGYNNRAAVPDHPQWFARYAELSEATRTALACELDVRYGPGPKETLDVFPTTGPPRATFVFIHGGYWRALDKADFAFVAMRFIPHGIAVASLNYDLCPDVSIATIAQQCRRAITWVVRDGGSHGLNTERIVIGGHSAGGHLAALMLTAEWGPLEVASNAIAGAVTISGVHDLSPLVLFSFNSDLKLDDAEAARVSPVNASPGVPAPIVIATGADETSEFVRQAWVLWERWPANRPRGMDAPLLIPQRNHFSIIVDYADADSALTRATLALF